MLFDEIINEYYDLGEYPAQACLTREWNCTRPFDGMNVLAATPIFRNTLVQYRMLIAGGATLYVGRAVDLTSGGEGSATSMPCDPQVIELLQANGIPVVSPEQVLAAEQRGDFMDLILDCAGQFSACHPRLGFVELTRSGVQFYENAEKPVYVADSGIVKRIETSLGTGDGYFRALQQLGFIAGTLENSLSPDESASAPAQNKLVVFGSGKVGCGIALQGINRGFDVTTVTDTSRMGSATDFSHVLQMNGVDVVDFRDYPQIVALIENADFVVTATGVKNALARPEIVAALLRTKAVLANMGVEDEYGADVPAERVLAKKSPLNFILEEPTHLKYIDASMALHAALAERLVQEAEGMVPAEMLTSAERESGPRNPPAELEQRLLTVTIQNGVVGPEVCGMLGLAPEMD